MLISKNVTKKIKPDVVDQDHTISYVILVEVGHVFKNNLHNIFYVDY